MVNRINSNWEAINETIPWIVTPRSHCSQNKQICMKTTNSLTLFSILAWNTKLPLSQNCEQDTHSRCTALTSHGFSLAARKISLCLFSIPYTHHHVVLISEVCQTPSRLHSYIPSLSHHLFTRQSHIVCHPRASIFFSPLFPRNSLPVVHLY